MNPAECERLERMDQRPGVYPGKLGNDPLWA